MNLKLIKLNKNDYNRIKETSLDLSNEVPLQEVLGVFDVTNLFIYEYDSAITSKDSSVNLLMPRLDEDYYFFNVTNKIKTIAKLFASEAYARVNEQSMFFIKDNKILEIT